MAADEPGTWLPLAAASRALAVTVDALRKRIAAREIQARKDNKNRWLVRVPADLAVASGPLADDETTASLREELTEARERAARAEERALAKDELITEVKATLALERDRANRLEAELQRLNEAARRPWWRKLIGR
jgi:phosphoglycolate phosphatase-like HAD superfamily hydrolase